MTDAKINALKKSIAFQYGVAGLTPPETDDERRGVYGDEVIDVYNTLSEDEKEIASLTVLYTQSLSSKNWPRLYRKIFSPETTEEQRDFILAQAREASDLRLELNSETALNCIVDMPKIPRDLDGYVAAACYSSNGQPEILQRDQWGYAQGTGNQQSYETVTSSSLASNSTINQLDGNNTHFMMFQKGQTQVRIRRFTFVDKPNYDDSSSNSGDPRAISKQFLDNLGLAGDLYELLQVHAKRLEMVQRLLSKAKQKFREKHCQLLFAHVLGYLVKDLDSEENTHVTDVTGIDSVAMRVQVCNEYLYGRVNHQFKTQKGRMLYSRSSRSRI